MAIFSECNCSSHTSKQSVFRRLTSTSQSAKRCRSNRRRAFSDVEYPEVTANMVNRSRGKQLAVNFNESDTEPEGVYRHTRTRTGTVAPINYSALARGIDVTVPVLIFSVITSIMVILNPSVGPINITTLQFRLPTAY